MSLSQHIIPVLIILFFSTTIRSAFGFGDALIAMPLLVWLLGVRAATPLVAFIASTIALTILVRNWRQVNLKSAWRLIAATLAGIPLGLFLLKNADETILKVILACVLILFSTYRLFHPRLLFLRNDKWAFVFGFIAGILGGGFNTNGPPVVIYGTLRQWSPQSFRATLQGYFFPTGLFILAGHGMAGLWTNRILRLYLFALPVVLLAVFIGGKIYRVIPESKFDRIIYGLLLVMGLLLIGQTCHWI